MHKTCYQKLVEAVVANPDKNFIMDDFVGFSRRGQNVLDFESWVKTAKWVLDVLKEQEGTLNQKKEYCRSNFKSLLTKVVPKVPQYSLFDEEVRTILKAEKLGKGKTGEILRYQDCFGEKNVVSYPHRHIPYQEGGRKDILLVFSGYHGTGTYAAEAFYEYVKSHKSLPYGIMLLGLEDNQNLTEFNNSFSLRKSSEYRMYMRQLIALGLPKGLLKKLLMTPNDTSTFQNIALIADTMRKYHLSDVNLICITYPLYQLRVASEVSFGLSKLDNIGNAWVRIADLPIKGLSGVARAVDVYEKVGMEVPLHALFNTRIFSYDKPEMQLADLTMANSIAHLFRQHGVERFAIEGFDKYPERFKGLAPLFLGYSYPNVVKELCGTDELVSSVLKIIRTLMLDNYDKGASGKAQDTQMLDNTLLTASRLVSAGLTSFELMIRGRLMSEEQFLEKVLAFQRSGK